MKNRLDYIDEMKGLAILSVVVGHIYLPHTVEGSMHPVASMIYSFHMAFFFFLSGYVNNKVNTIEAKGYKNFVSKKISSLIIPYLFWLLVAPLFLNNYIPDDLTSLVDIFNFFPNRHYWFLPVLFIFMMLYLVRHYVIKRLPNLEIHFDIISIGLWCFCGVMFHQYHLIGYGIYWFSFLFGNAISEYTYLREFIIKKSAWGISAIILCVTWKFYPLVTNGIMWKSFTNLLLSFISALTGSITLYNFFIKAKINKWIKIYLQEMGKYSLVIYLVPIALFSQGFQFSETYPTMVTNLLILVIGIIHTLVSYTFGRVIFEIPYLRYLMFGKK